MTIHPDLLAAIRAFLEAVDDGTIKPHMMPDFDRVVAFARAAIASAEGSR